jgi:hypothetical protein
MRIAVLAGLCAFTAVLHATIQADAQDASTSAQNGPLAATGTAKRPAAINPVANQPGAKVGKPYFIEFRARSALSYGHTFAVHGRVGSKITAKSVVGLHPFTESSVPWVLGHVLFVPSETGFSDGDIEDEYITARYRVLLTAAEYKKLTADLKELQKNSPVWHAAIYNCNAFVADIAKSLGLRAPFNKWKLPKDFIAELKELNTGTKPNAGSAATASIP